MLGVHVGRRERPPGGVSEGSKILTGVVFAEAIRPRLTCDALRDLLQDWRRAGKQMPIALLVSEYDRRDLNQDVMAGAKELDGDPDTLKPDHDRKAIAIIEGIPVRSHPDVAKGKMRMLFPDPKLTPKAPEKLGGEGLIIVGA